MSDFSSDKGTLRRRTPIYQGRAIDVGIEQVALPNGVETELEIIRHPGGAAAVAINDADEVCLLRQYRHAVDGWLWELPAGKIDNQEPPFDTVRRELAEEAGVRAERWYDLGVMISSPGVFTERVYLYWAEGLHATELSREVDEVMEVHWVPFDKALGWACGVPQDDAVIADAKSALALHRVARLRVTPSERRAVEQ